MRREVAAIHMWSPRQDLEEFSREISNKKLSKCPVVYLDFAVEGVPAGRVELTLRSDVCPRTCANFRALCTGETGHGYKGTAIHSVIRACSLPTRPPPASAAPRAASLLSPQRLRA